MKFATLALAALLAAPFGLCAQTPAEDFIEAGHWKRARALVEPRLRDAPNDPLAAFLMSQINFAFGHKEAPLDLAEKAVALAPGVAKYHRQLAEALGVRAQRSNLFQQAFLARRFKKEIDAALAIDPNDIQAQRDLMEYYLLAPGLVGGDRKQAEALAERIGRIDRGQGFLAQARIAQFYHDPARQESMLRKAVEASPSKYKIRIALAQFYTKEQVNWDAAAENARAAIEIDPTRTDGYSILAAAYAAEGRWPELETTLATADRAVPDDLTPYFRAAEAEIATGKNYAAAKADLRKYLTQEPEGNQPTLAEARQKLAEISGSSKASSSHAP
jgi:tetratricopeptide (TPR) repeat protein